MLICLQNRTFAINFVLISFNEKQTESTFLRFIYLEPQKTLNRVGLVCIKCSRDDEAFVTSFRFDGCKSREESVIKFYHGKQF